MNINYEEHKQNIDTLGYTIIRNGIDIDLVDRVVDDFNYWQSLPENNFKKHNFNRVTNFHCYSKNTLDLVTNIHTNNILELIFGTKQSIYSSLFFREGTGQSYHRDTPHFYTNPIDQYYGIWYSLEDIDINAGPLKYYIGSHKLDVPDGYETVNKLFGPDNIILDNQQNLKCLLEYNNVIEQLCKKQKLLCVDTDNYQHNKVNKGDIIIWHPKLLHGGSNIINNTLTRYSMVTHNTPINTMTLNASHFFTNVPTKQYLENKCTFQYIKHNDINIVDHNTNPKVQTSYT